MTLLKYETYTNTCSWWRCGQEVVIGFNGHIASTFLLCCGGCNRNLLLVVIDVGIILFGTHGGYGGVGIDDGERGSAGRIRSGSVVG
jgi:hypothetical protein